jgi:hypothetical protein
MNEIAIQSKNIKATEYGIEFAGNVTMKEWFQAVQSVHKVKELCQWYLGDLIVYAESPLTGWGEKYNELIDITGYDYGTLAKFAYAARRFTPGFRESVFSAGGKNSSYINLSWGHFIEVASLSDEKALYLLDAAQEGGWGRDRLREEVANLKRKPSLPEPKENLETEEVPDGFVPFQENDFYIPAPEPVLGEDKHETCKVELYDWEAKLVFKYIKNDDKLISLAGRLALFLDSA